MPARSAGRQMRVAKIVVLVTGTALLGSHAVPFGTASYIHGMGMAVITLTGKVSHRVAIHTTRVPQNWDKRREERSIPSCWRGSGAAL